MPGTWRMLAARRPPQLLLSRPCAWVYVVCPLFLPRPARLLCCGSCASLADRLSLLCQRTARVVRSSRLFQPTYGAESLSPRAEAAPGASANAASVELLLRGGHVRQSSAGVFTLLPSGLRILRKVSDVVREEMTSPAGLAASELAMPALLPASLWRASGRWEAMRPELLTLAARSGTEYLLGPTHEEEVTRLVAQEAPSHRQLPVRVFQITSKFRNEPRPRAGLLRTREFMMKDLYTFDADPRAAREAYHQVRQAYARILDRLLGTRHGSWVAAVADTGAIGGELSHEYHLPDPLGEDTLLSCSSCHGTWNQELAPAAPRGISVGSNVPNEANDVQVALFAPATAFEVHTHASSLPGTEDQGPTPSSPSQLHAFIVPRDRTLNEAAVVRASKDLALQPVRLGDPPIGPGGLNAFFHSIKLHVDRECTLMDPMEMMEAVSQAVLAAVDPQAAQDMEQGTWSLGPPPLLYDLFPAETIPTQDGLGTTNTIESQVGTYSQAQAGDQCGQCARQSKHSLLHSTRSIEVAHAFLLGTRYSDALGVGFDPAPGSIAAEIATQRNPHRTGTRQQPSTERVVGATATEPEGSPANRENPQSHGRETQEPSHSNLGKAPFQMGCYGVGISRLIGALAQRAAARGAGNTLVWPRSVAPYVAYVIVPTLDKADEATQRATERVLRLLTSSSSEAEAARSRIQEALLAALRAQTETQTKKHTHMEGEQHSEGFVAKGDQEGKGTQEVSFFDSPLKLEDVVLDDRAATVPRRLIDAELLGAPVILVLGRAWQKSRQVEVIVRDAPPANEGTQLNLDTLVPARRVTAFVPLDEADLTAISAVPPLLS